MNNDIFWAAFQDEMEKVAVRYAAELRKGNLSPVSKERLGLVGGRDFVALTNARRGEPGSAARDRSIKKGKGYGPLGPGSVGSLQEKPPGVMRFLQESGKENSIRRERESKARDADAMKSLRAKVKKQHEEDRSKRPEDLLRPEPKPGVSNFFRGLYYGR